MSIDELFKSAAKPTKLTLDEWLESLDEADRKAVYSWAASRSISTRKFHDIITSKGVAIARESVDKWRRENGLV